MSNSVISGWGSACGRCWHNHTSGSGIICSCTCHTPTTAETFAPIDTPTPKI
jgi:hypothetical protein